jgi:predicted nucleic acid-binding protein
MGSEYLIDTNTAIDYLDNRLPENANLLIEGSSVKLSVINRMELLSWPGANEVQTSVLEKFIQGSTVYPLNEPVIIKTIAIRKIYKTKLPRCDHSSNGFDK